MTFSFKVLILIVMDNGLSPASEEFRKHGKLQS